MQSGKSVTTQFGEGTALRYCASDDSLASPPSLASDTESDLEPDLLEDDVFVNQRYTLPSDSGHISPTIFSSAPTPAGLAASHEQALNSPPHVAQPVLGSNDNESSGRGSLWSLPQNEGNHLAQDGGGIENPSDATVHVAAATPPDTKHVAIDTELSDGTDPFAGIGAQFDVGASGTAGVLPASM